MNVVQWKSASRLIALVSVSLGLVAAESHVAKAGIVYVSGSGNEFGTLDLSTGAFSQISTFNLPTGGVMFGMGTASPGTLTGIDDTGEAYTINAATGAITDQGATGTFPIGAGGTSAILYSYDIVAQQLDALNFNNYTISIVGTYPFEGDGLVVAGPNGQVYVAALTNGADDLYDIDTATGIATDLGSTGDTSLFAGVYANGQIYGFDAFGNIVTLSATTGQATFVTTYALPNDDAIYAAAAFPAAVPEPSTLTMVGLGFACVVGVAGRRRAVKA